MKKNSTFAGILIGMGLMLILVVACGFAPAPAPVTGSTANDEVQPMDVRTVAESSGGTLGANTYSFDILTFYYPDKGYTVTIPCMRYQGYVEAGLTCDWDEFSQ